MFRLKCKHGANMGRGRVLVQYRLHIHVWQEVPDFLVLGEDPSIFFQGSRDWIPHERGIWRPLEIPFLAPPPCSRASLVTYLRAMAR